MGRIVRGSTKFWRSETGKKRNWRDECVRSDDEKVRGGADFYSMIVAMFEAKEYSMRLSDSSRVEKIAQHSNREYFEFWEICDRDNSNS